MALPDITYLDSSRTEGELKSGFFGPWLEFSESRSPGRNLIDNSNFSINQSAVSGTVSLSAGEYGHDRWKAGASGCTYTFAESAGVTTLTISAGSLIQVVPGDKFGSGTHVLSWAGTAQASIDSGTAGDSGLTATLTGGTDSEIEIGTGTVAQVKLERGTVATEYEPRSEVEELAACTGYYWPINYANGTVIANGYFVGTTTARVSIPAPQYLLRSTPGVVYPAVGNFRLTSASNNLAPTDISILSVGAGVINLSLTVSGATALEACILRAVTTGQLEFDNNL